MKHIAHNESTSAHIVDNPFTLNKIIIRLFKKFRRAISRSIRRSYAFWFIAGILLNGFLLVQFLLTTEHAMLAAKISIFNLLIAIIARNEYIVYWLYKIGKHIKSQRIHWAIYTVGSLHKNMAFYSLAWLIVYVALDFDNLPWLMQLIAIAIPVGLGIIIFTALNFFRVRFHNTFELIHRYLGRSVLILTMFLIAWPVISNQPNQDFTAIAISLLSNPAFLMLCTILALILEPWIAIKKVKPKVAFVNDFYLVLIVPGSLKAGGYARISLDRKEWHAFACSTLGEEEVNEYCLIIRKVGDWTTQLIQHCQEGDIPQQIYIRKFRPYGFMYHISAYKRILIVATGAGIAPVLPHLIASKAETHCIWIAHNHRETFGDKVFDNVMRFPNVHLRNTHTKRSGFVTEIIDMYHDIKADALFVVSNAFFSEYIESHCMREGIKYHGPTFDS